MPVLSYNHLKIPQKTLKKIKEKKYKQEKSVEVAFLAEMKKLYADYQKNYNKIVKKDNFKKNKKKVFSILSFPIRFLWKYLKMGLIKIWHGIKYIHYHTKFFLQHQFKWWILRGWKNFAFYFIVHTKIYRLVYYKFIRKIFRFFWKPAKRWSIKIYKGFMGAINWIKDTAINTFDGAISLSKKIFKKSKKLIKKIKKKIKPIIAKLKEKKEKEEAPAEEGAEEEKSE